MVIYNRTTFKIGASAVHVLRCFDACATEFGAVRVVQGVLKGNEGLARVGKGPRSVSTLFEHLEMFYKGASKG